MIILFKKVKKIVYWVIFILPFLYIFFNYKEIPNFIVGIKKDIFIIHYFLFNLLSLIVINKRIKKTIKNEKTLYRVSLSTLFSINILPFILIIYSSGIISNIKLPQIIALTCGLIFLGFSFIFKNIKRNDVIGIKTKWSLEDDKVWEKTHEIGSISWLLGGITFIFSIFAKSEKIYLIIICLGLIEVLAIPIISSYYIHRKINKNNL